MAGALLYFWLLGHWFARVLMCILLVLVGVFIGLANMDRHPEGAALLTLIGAGVGWAAGSAPVWYWRKRLAAMSLQELFVREVSAQQLITHGGEHRL